MDAKPGPALTFGNGGARTLTDVEWDRGIFDATVVADLPLPSDRGRGHELNLALHFGASTIDGFATDALTNDGMHQHFGIPYSLHLVKMQSISN
jgi:hypothetical protein